MALSAKTGNFALNTTTGNQAITGVGFQPKVVLFFSTLQTTSGVGVDKQEWFGVGISSTARGVIGATSNDAAAAGDTTRANLNTHCIFMMNAGTSTIVYRADFVSQDADGFTINLIVAPASAYLVGYLALGGDDLTNVATNRFTSPTATGNQSTTGVGFQPDAVIFFTTGQNSADVAQTFANFGLGFAISSTQRAGLSTGSEELAATSDTYRYQRTNQAIVVTNPTSGAVFLEADLVSMDADGFTLNWTTVQTARYIYYLALKGGQYKIGSFNSQTATGNFSQTGVGFQPVAGIFGSFCNAAATVSQAHSELSLGIATATTERFVAGATDEDAQADMDADNFCSITRLYQNYDFAQAVEGDIDFVSWDADGFTLNQTDADPTGNEIIYLVLGASVPPAIAKRSYGYMIA